MKSFLSKILFILFIILFLPACPFKYMEDPDPPIIIPENSNCSRYGCGGGICEGEGSISVNLSKLLFKM